MLTEKIYLFAVGRTWRIIHEAKLTTITRPVLFIGGEKDFALGGQNAAAFEATARLAATDVRGVRSAVPTSPTCNSPEPSDGVARWPSAALWAAIDDGSRR